MFISPLHLFTHPLHLPHSPSPVRVCPGPGWGVLLGCTVGPQHAGGAGVLPAVGDWSRCPRLPVPVRRYPRVGDHDGLQVEAPVAQIPAERGGRATARRNSGPHRCAHRFPKPQCPEVPGTQAPVQGPRGTGYSWGSLSAWGPSAHQGRRGGCARAEEGWPCQHGVPGSCSISPAGSRRCCFHF